MTELKERHCVPCEGGVAPYTATEARALLARVHPDWRLNDAGTEIRRDFKFRDFHHTMSFVNALAHVANVEDHHPDMELGYNYCHVRFSTHSIKGLSENDFICAAKLDALVP
jgi:4a-hydroxytetrahydrobiopterin dehydratase